MSCDLGKDRWAIWLERVLRDGHHHRTALHSPLNVVKALVQWRVGIPRCAKHLPQKSGHAVPVQAGRVKVALLVYHNKHQALHLPKDRGISDKLDRTIR